VLCVGGADSTSLLERRWTGSAGVIEEVMYHPLILGTRTLGLSPLRTGYVSCVRRQMCVDILEAKWEGVWQGLLTILCYVSSPLLEQ
jgi:hypothetical protein